MSVLNVTFSKLSSKKPAYHVGHRLYSRTKLKGLFKEKEIFVNEIKHFRVSIKGPIKKSCYLK